jgi:hypothetical protein
MFGWSSVYISQLRRLSQKKSVPFLSRKSSRVYLLFRVIRKGHFIPESFRPFSTSDVQCLIAPVVRLSGYGVA